MSSIGVFLDRDGTINEELEFITSPQELRLIPGAASAVRQLNERRLVTCVISNQSGVARGYLTEDDLVPIHETLLRALADEGARVDSIYYCPHHPTSGIPPYNVDCECRKPKPGMLKRAELEFGLSLTESFVVGDRVVDVRAAHAVGATSVLVLTGYGQTAREECLREKIAVDCIAPSIVEAVEYILNRVNGRAQTSKNVR